MPSSTSVATRVSETVFRGVNDGVFLDVGSADGVVDSNTFALERKGWTGICVDPFPTGMARRTCQMFKEVVWVSGRPSPANRPRWTSSP